MVVPLGCQFTPLKRGASVVTVPYAPLACRGPCRSVLNPYCTVDVQGQLWVCPFCYQRNQFPQQYGQISANNMPPELMGTNTTMEYTLPQAGAPATFLFVVDTCLTEDNLKALKDSLLLALTLLPENSYVGLITYGTMVQVYELSFVELPKSHVFRGSKEFDAKEVQQQLGLTAAAQQPAGAAPAGASALFRENAFILPLSDAEFNLTSILEELQRDPRPVKNDHRPLRSTGAALSVAIGLLENICPSNAGRIMLFTGGPCTQGNGMIVSEELKDTLRSHSDLQKGKAKFSGKAAKFYESLTERVSRNSHVVDVYTCSFDQTGLMEMRSLVKATGGLIIQADSFDHPVFKQSFSRVFARDANDRLNMQFNATLEVQCSRELRLCGAIGHLISLRKKGPTVSETEIGLGQSSAWKICGLNHASTYSVFFEVANQHNQPAQSRAGVLQFLTHYQNAAGQKFLRVTTVSRAWADPAAGNAPLAYGFDQEAAAVIMARLATFKADTEEAFDSLRWLDRMLIRFIAKFGDYRKDDPNSLQLSAPFALYPQFMFYLRRSNFIQVFNNSPDEATFLRYTLHHENVTNSLIMVQPTLEAYSFDGPPQPVLLSVLSVMPTRILLLDSFFHVVIFHGDQIVQWRNDGHAESNQSFRQLLQAPKDDATLILKDRFPLPRFIECDQGSSQARFLLALLDPAVTHNNAAFGQEMIFTDSVSLNVFMEHLKKLVVTSSS